MSGGTFGGVVRNETGWTSILDFESCDAAIDPNITVTGGANCTRVNGTGNVEAISGARIQHKPVANTNELQYSDNISNAAWAKTRASTSTSRVLRGPKGETLYRLTEDSTASSTHDIRQYVTKAAASMTYKLTFMVKPDGSRTKCFAWLHSSSQNNRGEAWFDLSAITASNIAVQGTGFSSVSATIVASGGGCFLCTLNVTTDTDTTIRILISTAVTMGSSQVNGDGVSGLYIGKLKLSPSAATAAHVVTAGAARTVYDSYGLLNEPTNTNQIRNSVMAGAVVGTPGTPPTYMSTGGSGHQREIVGTGVEDGIPYVDFRIFGTPSASPWTISLEGATIVPAAVGQTWTVSTHIALVGGSLTNMSIQMSMAEYASGSLAGATNSANLSLSATPLKLSRVTHTHTTVQAGTTSVLPRFRIGINIGVAIDATFRIGLPQIEQKDKATSGILTAGSAVTATEAHHLISSNTFAQYFKGQGTFLIEFTPLSLKNGEVFWGIGQTFVFNNSLYLTTSGGNLYLVCYSAATNTVSVDLGAMTVGVRHKVAISLRSGEIAARMNGGAEQLSTGALPAVIDNEALLTSPWSGGSGGVDAYMHVRKYKPVPSRGDLYALTV